MPADTDVVTLARQDAQVVVADRDGRLAIVVPVLLGAVAAVLPSALRGWQPTVGLGACGLWGLVGALGGSLLWAHGGVVRATAGLEAHGVLGLAFAHGRPHRRDRVGALLAGALLTARGAGWGLAAGVLAGLTAQLTHAHLALGLSRGPSGRSIAAAVAAGAVVTVAAWLLARACGRPSTSLMWWRAAVVAFVALTGAAPWFHPAPVLAAFMPVASVWPVTASGAATRLLAVRLTLPTRVLSGATWIAIGFVGAAWAESHRSLLPVEGA